MGLKAKLTRLENRLGVERCPHCAGALPLRPGEDVPYCYTPEEKFTILSKIFQRTLDSREQLLALVAAVAPSQRLAIADVYPLEPGEVLGDAGGNES
jgi:hypothetical protein